MPVQSTLSYSIARRLYPPVPVDGADQKAAPRTRPFRPRLAKPFCHFLLHLPSRDDVRGSTLLDEPLQTTQQATHDCLVMVMIFEALITVSVTLH